MGSRISKRDFAGLELGTTIVSAERFVSSSGAVDEATTVTMNLRLSRTVQCHTDSGDVLLTHKSSKSRLRATVYDANGKLVCVTKTVIAMSRTRTMYVYRPGPTFEGQLAETVDGREVFLFARVACKNQLCHSASEFGVFTGTGPSGDQTFETLYTGLSYSNLRFRCVIKSAATGAVLAKVAKGSHIRTKVTAQVAAGDAAAMLIMAGAHLMQRQNSAGAGAGA